MNQLVFFLDIIAIPEFAAGAMENWGLITFRESDLLYEEGVSSSFQKQRVAMVVAHELAHQVCHLFSIECLRSVYATALKACAVYSLIGLSH